MDFLAICLGLGLALAAGIVVGAVVPPAMPAWGAIAGAAPVGVLVCAAALNGANEDAWPAIPIGIAAAGLAAVVARDVVTGAARREAETGDQVGAQASPGLTGIAMAAAAVLAVLSLFVPPVSLVALLALLWLWFSRRRIAGQKHEGLRVLR